MVEVYWFVSCRRIKIGLKQNLTSAIFLIWGFHIHLTRATAQPKNPSDVSFFAKQTNDLIVTEKSSAITGLSGSRLYLHVCIGIMSLILVFLTITHFYVSFKKKKKKNIATTYRNACALSKWWFASVIGPRVQQYCRMPTVGNAG